MDEGLAGLADGYGFTEPAAGLGRAVKGEEVNTGFEVAVPLAMLTATGWSPGPPAPARPRPSRAWSGGCRTPACPASWPT